MFSHDQYSWLMHRQDRPQQNCSEEVTKNTLSIRWGPAQMNFFSLTCLVSDSGMSLLTLHGLWVPPVPVGRANQDFSSFLRIFFALTNSTRVYHQRSRGSCTSIGTSLDDWRNNAFLEKQWSSSQIDSLKYKQHTHTKKNHFKDICVFRYENKTNKLYRDKDWKNELFLLRGPYK